MMKISITKMLHVVLEFRLLRFILVGGFSSAAFSIFMIMFVTIGITNTVYASGLSYVLAIPTNFYAHKLFTFRSNKPIISEFPIFLVVQFANILLTMTVMYLVDDVIQLHYFFAILAIVIAIPLSTYVMMRLFVFKSQK